ncbi:MAG TPA: polysaccharide deacetylase family protein [Candidatus Limnocylindrales bacterium]
MISLARSVGRALTRPVGTVREVATAKPHLVLTYDDGPDPEQTPGVLAALASFGATATFFVLVPRARRNPGLLAEVLAAGHEIALHGVDHARLTGFSARTVLRRCRDGRAELEDLTGRAVRWFRAPYGALLPRHWAAVRAAGLMPVAWGPTPGDWRPDLSEEQLAADALRGCSRGGILLAHDGYAGPEDGADDGAAPEVDRSKLASLILQGLRERALEGRSLADSLADGRTRSWAWFHR